MKIAVTGHTSGIGKGLYDFYKKKGHEVLGFSRFNGHDIGKNQDEITAKAEDSDIFFNNAYSGFAQTELIFKLWEKWRDKEKLIISSNSTICRVSFPYTYHPLASPYKIHKLSLDQAVRELQQSPSKCQISQLILGFVDTNFFLHRHKMFKDKKKLKVEQIVEMAELIVSKWKNVRISSIDLGEVY